MSKFCTNCGQELSEEVSFCINCGKKINTKIKSEEVDKAENVHMPKSRIIAGLLGIFLGSLGIHNFYLGYNKKAIAQLLITGLSFGSLSFVSSIWSLIEGIMILVGSINVDAKGNPLGE